MDSKQWEKITSNYDAIKDVYPKDVIRILFQMDVIDVDDKQNLEAISADRDRMEELCFILKKKPAQKKAYGSFLESLRKTTLPHYISLAHQIDQTETKSDGSLTAQVDPKCFEEIARRILVKHFVDKKGAKTPFSDFMEVLRSNDEVFRDTSTSSWTYSYLYNFITKLFTRARKVQKAIEAETGKKQSTKAYIINVARIEPMGNETGNRGTSSLSSEIDKPFNSLTPTEVKDCLKPHFEQQEISSQPLIELEKNDVSGEILLSMTKENIKEAAPSSTFGFRHLLMTLLEGFRKQSKFVKPSSPQILRAFDFPANDVSYIQGNCVVPDSFDHGQKRNVCVKCFHVAQDEDWENIAYKVVLFIAACINERRNGTIYFGINHKSGQLYSPGEIVGITNKKEEVQKKVDAVLHQAFQKQQMNFVKKVVRSAKSIPVHRVSGNSIQQESQRWVIELDIEPSNAILGKLFPRIWPKSIPYLKKKCEIISCYVCFSDHGEPEILDSRDKEYNFEQLQKSIIAERAQHEMQPVERDIQTQNVFDRFQKLVTGGYQSLDDNVFPFLILGPPKDDSSLNEIKQLVHFLNPEVVFDFGHNDSINSFYKLLDEKSYFRVLTLDNFGPQEEENYQSIKVNLQDECNCAWVFCNGYQPTSMEPLINPFEWNMKRRHAFQKTLETFLSIFDKGRILPLICIFSLDESAIVEACDEILLHFPDQWILLVESETVAQTWQSLTLPRKRVRREEDLLQRSIVGMTWERIAACFKSWCKYEETQTCKIPHSNGSPVEIQEKSHQSWSDVEIFSMSDPLDRETEEISQIAKKVEEEFYKGQQVERLNFWFEGQVLKRSIHEDLKCDVEKALLGNDGFSDDHPATSSVFLYHQPGAGGTTVAKQILWDLRTKYRCCAILNITENTCDQLEEIYLYGDEHPKPLLLLVDNEENEKLERLRNDLKVKGSEIHSRHDGASNVFCVILICMRCSDLPVTNHRSQNVKTLRQELEPHELQWFKSKNSDLLQRFTKNTQENTDPKFLISFNFLKENFDRKQLEKSVQEFVHGIKEEKEKNVLKYVSLLNTFDVNFTEIPVDVFDTMFKKKAVIFQNTQFSYAHCSRKAKWEITVSTCLKVLLNISKIHRGPRNKRKTVRIINQLFAREILNCIMNTTKQNASDLILELMDSKIFKEDSIHFQFIHQTIKNIIIKRQYQLVNNTVRKEQFSPLLLHIWKKENAAKAIEIFETFYSIRKDAFVAQHIARFYTELKDFTSAEKYASLAVMSSPKNSHLLNTCGQVLLKKLKSMVEDSTCQNNPMERMKELVEIFAKCRDLFKNAQLNNCSNGYGDKSISLGLEYILELQSIAVLLNGLEESPLFESKEMFHKYLIDEEFTRNMPDFLNSICVKALFQDCQKIQQTVDEILVSCNFQKVDEFTGSDLDHIRAMFSNVKIDLDRYFGEDEDEPPTHLSEKEKCAFRYRRVRSKGVKFIKYLSDVKTDELQLKMFEDSCILLWNNVDSQFCSFNDLKAMLDIVTVLMINGKLPSQISYCKILQWSQRVCSERPAEASREHNYFVPLWYYVLFHFPTPERMLKMASSPCCCKSFVDVCQSWQQFACDSQKAQNPSFGKYNRDKVLFCLGNGKPLEDLIYFGDYFHEAKMEDVLLSKREKLRHMTGTLKEGGKSIQFLLPCQKCRRSCNIPTLHCIKKRHLWQKKVSFYLGFCQFELKAYCVMDKCT